ncbi:ECF-type sigma factor [bacterium]|nr:ECF-type sigma factor [bacterium]
MARGLMARIPSGQTLQATALVNEAYLRLVESELVTAKGRQYFFKSAGEAMRRILVDQARRKGRVKRGGNMVRVDIADMTIAEESDPEEILAVHEALKTLADRDAGACELVKLKYFVGMTNREAAESLGMSERSVNRNWTYARAFLADEIRQRLDS